MRYSRKLSMVLLLAALVAQFGCGPSKVNTNPTKYDTPTEVLNGIVSSTNGSAAIYKNHHNAKRADLLAQAAAVKANKALGKDERNAQLLTIQQALVAETNKFDAFNGKYKDALRYERDAGNVIKGVATSGGSTTTATAAIKLASNVVVNELLAQIDDQSTKDSLVALNNLMQQLITKLGGQ